MKNILPELETLDFIRQHRNIVLYGNPGTGKTHVATALGIKAYMEGMSVLFTSVPHLITQIKECRSSRTLHALENRYKKYDLVICDEFGYVSCDKEAGSCSSTTSLLERTENQRLSQQILHLKDGMRL